MEPQPFRIDVPAAEVEDLRARLRRTRLPVVEPNDDFARGTSAEYLRGLLAAWADDFDWPAMQAAYNTLPQVTADVDGTTLHLVHARSARPDAVPLLLVHGWPDTPFRFRHLVGPLTDPRPVNRRSTSSPRPCRDSAGPGTAPCTRTTPRTCACG